MATGDDSFVCFRYVLINFNLLKQFFASASFYHEINGRKMKLKYLHLYRIQIKHSEGNAFDEQYFIGNPILNEIYARTKREFGEKMSKNVGELESKLQQIVD
jgi:hypothetical protein